MPDRDDDKQSSWAQIGKYTELGVLLPAATFIGWIIGSVLDRWLHTGFLYLVGLLVGIAAGFVQLIRTVMKET
jgi:F0F1-type ATP synthase assembly protein I